MTLYNVSGRGMVLCVMVCVVTTHFTTTFHPYYRLFSTALCIP